ncbi:MAG: nucleoside-diphosphate kinase [Candidatus Freyarchaeota archaeon]|nr:nucleoside-diphosphate kinase [Candidatus Freyrarchaeum guaymaensis]
MERTLVLLKPDATVRRFVGANTIKALLDEGYEIHKFAEIQVNRKLAEQHYEEHVGKPFFNWLVFFIMVAPVVAMEVKGENVVQGVRKLLGATLVQNAEPNTIRGKYGIWGGVNVAHASDSIQTAERELSIWLTKTELGEKENGKQAEKYVEKWIQSPRDNTQKLRKICENLSEGKIEAESAQEEIEMLILEENPHTNSQYVTKLAKAIVQNCLID